MDALDLEKPQAREDEQPTGGVLRTRRPLSVVTRARHPFGAAVVATLGVLLTVALAFAVMQVANVLLAILLAVFLALGLDPLVKWLGTKGVGRGWAVGLVFGVFAVIVAAFVAFVLPRAIAQVIELAQSIPDAMAAITRTEWFQTATSTMGIDAEAFRAAVVDLLADPGRLVALTGGLLAAAGGVAGSISNTFVIVVLTLYFLGSIEVMKRTFYRLVSAPSRATVVRLTETITDSMGGFVMTMIVLGACNAGVVLLLNIVLGLPFPTLMAVVAFFLTLIPVVGSVLFWIVGTAVALFADPTAAIVFALAYLVYMQIESYVLTPRLMGRTIQMPGILVLVGALLGAALLGLLGALVAVPVTAALTLIIREVVLPRQDSVVAHDL